ncbi:MAG: hypothetical protein ACE5KI_04360 [Dehalococcoidia bacterium]
MRRATYAWLILALSVFAAATLAPFVAPPTPVSADVGDCGDFKIIVTGGEPDPFELPRNAGKTLEADPDAALVISRKELPENPRIRLDITGVGFGLTKDIVLSGVDDYRENIGEYSKHTRGLFDVRGTLLSGDEEICTIPFRIRIKGFGGTAATASAVATAVAGVGALASAPLTASSTNVKIKLKAQLERRRPRGWRRWFPAPAWKRTIVSTLIGAFTGLCTTVLLQQGGVFSLALATAIWGTITGGGVTFGVGYSLGVLWTYFRPPREEPEQS